MNFNVKMTILVWNLPVSSGFGGSIGGFLMEKIEYCERFQIKIYTHIN
jgi:hypothetical protein